LADRRVGLRSGLGIQPDDGRHILGTDAVYVAVYPRQAAWIREMWSRSAAVIRCPPVS